jgi:tRNA(fMet)-specific endonuclease VapC
MSLAYLLDTNIVSEPLRPSPDQHVLELLERTQHELAIASLVWHELLFGYERLPDSTKKRASEAYLNDVVAGSLPVLPYDARAASWHASERARLTTIGKTPSFVDGQIAAIAAVNELTLVTANISDYSNFSELRVENWKN